MSKAHRRVIFYYYKRHRYSNKGRYMYTAAQEIIASNYSKVQRLRQQRVQCAKTMQQRECAAVYTLTLTPIQSIVGN